MDDSLVRGEQGRDLCEDINRENLPERLEELEIQIDRLKQRWGEFTYLIGQRLKYIRDEQLYRKNNYPDFKSYVTIALKMSENNAYYYISIFEYFTEEQTRQAGSKLKLLIPVLNKVKRDRAIPEDIKSARMNDLRDELYSRIYNKSYREAEKIMTAIKEKYFTDLNRITAFKRIEVKKDRIIINESDEEIRAELVKLIEEYYSS